MRRVAHASAWVLLAAAALVLWPQAWGGTMTYVITEGTSMQPGFEEGDLAVLRTTGDYEPGDVAAYQSSQLETIVMHRVTRVSDGGYVFQGDNNDFVDPETVTDEQMLGKLLLRVPAFGNYLDWLLKPINLAVLAGAAFFLFADRKKEPTVGGTPAQPIGTLRLRSLVLPPSAATAELADEADLERLSAHYGRPILEVEGEARRYVLDGSVVYTWVKAAAAQPRERRSTPQGRDWNYPARHLHSVPVPRAAEDVRQVSSR